MIDKKVVSDNEIDNILPKSIEGLYREGEEAIGKNTSWSYFYARDVLEGRFLIGEEAISREGDWSYWYVTDVIKGRFLIGEEAIKRAGHWDNYVNFLKKKGIEI